MLIQTNKQSFFPTNEMIGALSDAFKCSFITAQRRVIAKDELLTGDIATEVFTKYGVVWNKETGMVDRELESVPETVQK